MCSGSKRIRRRRHSDKVVVHRLRAAVLVSATAACLAVVSACTSASDDASEDRSSASVATLGSATSITIQAVSATAPDGVRVDDSIVPEGTPILARARLPQGFELFERAIALYGYGYLDLSGPCVAIEYPLEEQLGLLDAQRARRYPFPGGPDVERFTIFVLEPDEPPTTEPSTRFQTRFYVDERDGLLALVEETYRDGVRYAYYTHRHGDRLATTLPSNIVSWPVPVPRNCPSSWMRLTSGSRLAD